MKHLVVVDDAIIDDIQEKYPHIEAKPIIRPMFVVESGDSVYLSQIFVDTLKEKAERLVIGEITKKHKEQIIEMIKKEVNNE